MTEDLRQRLSHCFVQSFFQVMRNLHKSVNISRHKDKLGENNTKCVLLVDFFSSTFIEKTKDKHTYNYYKVGLPDWVFVNRQNKSQYQPKACILQFSCCAVGFVAQNVKFNERNITI